MIPSRTKPSIPLPTRKIYYFVAAGFFILTGLACYFTWLSPIPPTSQPDGNNSPVSENPVASSLPQAPETEVNFQVLVPDNTPPDTTVYLSILDEVTGLALNAQNYPMHRDDTLSGVSYSYNLRLPSKFGSIILYRYERQAEGITVAEHVSDGSPVRYRLYHVEGPGTVEDVVSRWTDTPFEAQTGRITGQASDAGNEQPIAGLLITAGGQQTLTNADGSFLLEGLPPGVHNLVAFSLDGAYRTFQQGAHVAVESTTPAPLRLTAAPLVEVVFVVDVPANTPPVIPVRLAGNLYQLGNTFANLYGGISSLASNMPVLNPQSDGRYTLTMTLPAGADIRYKYTLGDGFWNAEHTLNGNFRLRQLIVPEQNVALEDRVDTWHSGGQGAITFDVNVPEYTPASDSIFIQFNPLFGWTEPIPMWSLGNNRWAYVLYSPLNLPGNFSYRYCRNAQCGRAGDASTPGEFGAGRPVTIGQEPQTIKEQVIAWAGLENGLEPGTVTPAEVRPRGAEFMSGVEFEAAYRPSWRPRLPDSLDSVQSLGANWLVLSPTWSFTRHTPPILEPVTGSDMLSFELVEVAGQGRARNLNIALNPAPRFVTRPDEWWQSAPRDFSWWLVWFDHYRNFAIHHADLATQTGAQALVLGGDWLTPALPGGTLADGSSSGVPANAEDRWRAVLGEVREHYSGKLLWALPYESLENPPSFLDAVDQVYLLWSVPLAGQAGVPQAELEATAAQLLDTTVLPFQQQLQKPLVLAVAYPSNPDMQWQLDHYSALLAATNQRDWIAGFVTRGFYPPAALRDQTESIHGKITADLLGYWFPRLTASPAP